MSLPPCDPLCSDLSEVATERLEAEITEYAGQISAATCRWLLLVGEFDRREAWREWECRGASQWLSWQCGVDPGTAREQVRVSRALYDLPKITEAFASGRLSYSKVRALTRVATPATEDQLLMIARHATAAQLELVVGAYRGVRRAEGLDEANERHHRRYLRYYYDEDGSLVMSMRLPPEEGALVVQAVEAARNRVARNKSWAERLDETRPNDENASAETPPGQADDRHQATQADAMVALAKIALTEEAVSYSSADRYQVVVHVDAESLAEGSGNRCEIEKGPALHPETVRRIACDAGLIGVLNDAQGRPLNVGRRTRTIPAYLRRALRNRDGGCIFPGCDHRLFIEAHHLIHWAQGGETSLENLVELCWFHHRLLHEGGFTAERDDEGNLELRRPDGKVIRAEPVSKKTYTGDLRKALPRSEFPSKNAPVSPSGPANG